MITLKDAADQWYHNHGRHLKDANNLKSIKRNLVMWFAGTKPIHHYGTPEISRYVEACRECGLAPATIKRNLGVLRRIINYACDHGHEVAVIKWPKIKTKPKMRHLTEQEQDALWRELEFNSSWPAWSLAVILLDTGMRLSEALALSDGDIDSDGNTIKLWRPKTETHTILPVSNHVLAAISPGLPIPVSAVPDLRRAIAAIADPVETQRHGKPTIHSLRDTFATNMLRKGLPIQDVSYLLGHSSIQQTMKYAHVIPSDVQERARRLLDG